MTSEQRSIVVLAFARVLYVNGQATEQTVAAAEQLGRILGLRAKVMPRWGELQLRSDDENGRVISEVAADPTGVDMDRVASAARAIEQLGAGRLAPGAAAEAIAATSGAAARFDVAFRACGRGWCRGAIGHLRRRAPSPGDADLRECRCRRDSAAWRGEGE